MCMKYIEPQDFKNPALKEIFDTRLSHHAIPLLLFAIWVVFHGENRCISDFVSFIQYL